MGLQTNQGQPAVKAPGLRFPFATGACASIVLGTITLYLEIQNFSSFQSALAATVVPDLIFGYFPITMIVSPLIMAVIMRVRYGNFKGFWWYFGGSAILGFLFSIAIFSIAILQLYIGYILLGPP
jgi:glucan phosphoethanolaminetransferase (alkaline phosphatase superfamily)